MIPRWHIILGAIFTLVIWIFAQNLSWIFLLLIFLSSFLVDLDHYIVSAIKTGKLNLGHSFEYHKKMKAIELAEKAKGIKRKGDFHLFHTIEFHVLIGIIGMFFVPFFYVFIGMVFHSLIDILYMTYQGRFYRREYFFFNWLRNKF